MLQLCNGSVENIWIAIKTIKAETSVNKKCNNDILDDDFILSQVEAVEQKLQIKSSQQKIETLTNEDLQTAAEMFIYLNMCPKIWFKFWSSFYSELFLQTTDKIILTLNRMMKSKGTQVKDGNIRAEKLMEKITNKLSLRYKEIQRLSRPQQKVECKTAHLNISDDGKVL